MFRVIRSSSSPLLRRQFSSTPSALALASKYKAIFDELELSEVNDGVFNGKWGGSGDLVHSYDPATNERIASVRTVKEN